VSATIRGSGRHWAQTRFFTPPSEIRVVLLRHPEQAPAVGSTLQLTLAGVFEEESRAGGQVLDGLGHQDLAWTGERSDLSPDVHRNVRRQVRSVVTQCSGMTSATR
jgi:hypothetical protein